jgi:hypothetical protein
MKQTNQFVLFFLLLGLLFTSCNESSELDSPYLKTPGAMYKIFPEEISAVYQLADWGFDPGHLLLVKGISRERGYEPYDLVLFDWSKGELEPFNIIEEYHRVKERAAQGKSGLIAYNDSGNLYLYNPKNQKKTLIAEEGYDPDFSPDGEQLAYWMEGLLIVTNITTLNPHIAVYSKWDEPQIEKITTNGTAWRPDGKGIAFIRNLEDEDGRPLKSEIMLMDFEDFSLRTLYSVSPTGKDLPFISDLTWSPDGRLIAFIEEGWIGKSYIKTILIGETDVCLSGSLEFQWEIWGAIRWSPAGNIIAVGRKFHEIYFINVEKVFTIPYSEMKCFETTPIP